MLPQHLIEKIEKVCEKHKIGDKHKTEITKRVQESYNNAKISPCEAIGIITAESFGEPSTQMSISYFENVIVKANNKISIAKIGELVDKLMEKEEPIKLHNSTEVLPIEDFEFYVPSVNNKEKIEWKKIVEVSRHKSPNKLLKIVTASGRKIIATDNHSFVTRMNNNIIPIIGSNLNVGSIIPSIKYLPEHCTESITITEFIDLPKEDSAEVKRKYRPTKLIPKNLKLDKNFGWFIGAYLSEGNSIGGQFSISNLDESYIENARVFIKSIGLDYKEKRHHRGFAESRDFIVNSSLLAKFIRATCDTNSYRKKVPQFAYSAKEEFVSSLLKGYFDGDGNFTVSRKMIRVSSNSEKLIDGIKLLLTRFRIFASKSKDHKQHYLMIPYKYAPIFLEKIGSDIMYKKKDLEILSDLAQKNVLNNYRDDIDMTYNFGNILIDISRKLGLHTRYVNSASSRQKIGLTALSRHRKRFIEKSKEKNIDISNELKIIDQMLCTDVVWDRIESINYVDTPHEYVYDFSVPGLETFTTFDGIITHNTLNVFHFAGVAEMQVTVGLPRLIEIFDARKSPSTPEMKIPIKSKFAKNAESVSLIAMKIKETKLSDIAQEISINVAKNTIEIVPDKKKMRELDIKPKELSTKIAESIKLMEMKDDGNVIILKHKDKTIPLSEVYKLKEKAKSIHVKGVKGITHVLPIKDEEGNYVIHCAGSNLKDALKIEEADHENIFTNNIFEVYEILGIEAARATIIKEAGKVIRDQGIDVDVRHIMLLADVMTNTGVIKGVTRTGISGEKKSVLARASFETPIKHIMNASLIGERDDLDSVVENVILNQPVPLGTGMPGLIAKVIDGDKK